MISVIIFITSNITININMDSKSNSNVNNLRSNKVNPPYNSIYYNKKPQQSAPTLCSTTIRNDLAEILALNQQLDCINHQFKKSSNVIREKSSISGIQSRIIQVLSELTNKNQEFQKQIASKLAVIERSVKASQNQHHDIDALTNKINRMENSLRQTQNNQAKLIDCLNKIQKIPHHECPQPNHYYHSQNGQKIINRNSPILLDESQVSQGTSRLRLKQISISHGARNKQEYDEKRYHSGYDQQGLSEYNHKGLRNYQAKQQQYGNAYSEQRKRNQTLMSNKSDINLEKAHRMNYLLNYLSV